MRGRRRRLGALTLGLLALPGCRAGRDVDPVILALGDQVVRRSAFERHVAALEAQGGESLAPEVLPSVLDRFLEERVLVLEARARGVLPPLAGPAAEQEAVQRLLQSDVLKGVAVGEAEVAAYYAARPQEFEIPATVAVRQILVATEAEARDVRRRLLKEPRSFERLARSLSKAPEAAKGGLMGVFGPGELPSDLEAAAFALGAGQVGDVVRTSLGYHILRVDSRTEARRASLAEAEGRIRGLLLRDASDRLVREFVSKLMSRAKVNHAAAHLRR
jgi:peptidyl-prolyl cis-trans isomerase C